MCDVALSALILVESFHVFCHLQVLVGISNIQTCSRGDRILYFAFDLMSSLLTFAFTRTFLIFVAIHGVIHVVAIAHLTFPFSGFFKSVYLLSETGVIKTPAISIWHRTGYVFGTCFDVLTHALNVFALFQMLCTSAPPHLDALIPTPRSLYLPA